ncbi:MAG: sensor histidine kinase [Candidatus Pristimantibacillus sp.]
MKLIRINLFKKLSIRVQVLLIGLIILAIIPLVIVKVYQQSSQTIITQNTQYNTELVSMLQQRVSANYANISNLMINLGYDTTVQNFLTESDKLTIYDYSKKVESLMSVVRSTDKNIVDIIIIGAPNIYASMYGNVRYANGIMTTIRDDGDVYYGGFQRKGPLLNNDIFIFGMNIYASGDNPLYGEKIGYITALMDVKSINSELEKYPRLAGTSFFVMDNRELVYTNSENNLSMIEHIESASSDKYSETAVLETIADKRYAIQSFELPEISGKIIMAVPISNLMKELEKLKETSYLLMIVTLLIVSIPYAVLMMNLLKPLTKLMRFMTKLKAGNLEVLHSKVNLEGYAEIEVISNEFNTMLERINDLTNQLIETTTKLYQVDLEKQRAEYAFLQSQINPHFLSNTLDSIKGIALVKGNKEIYEMTNALSTMLRYSIKGNDEVSLGEELKIAGACVKIHQGRFPGKITFEQICPEELFSIPVPKMMLQPIVENALEHGLELLGKEGFLRIIVDKRDDDCLQITIIDNGVGIDSHRLDLLHEQIDSQNITSNEHIGIQNVNNRIWLKYGEMYGIKIFSMAGQGTKVVITLPCNVQEAS